MANITKEQFDRFLELRNSGRINMNDIEAGCMLTRLTEETYTNIMWNFSELKTKFYNK